MGMVTFYAYYLMLLVLEQVSYGLEFIGANYLTGLDINKLRLSIGVDLGHGCIFPGDRARKRENKKGFFRNRCKGSNPLSTTSPLQCILFYKSLTTTTTL